MLAETFGAKAEGYPFALVLAQLPAFLGSVGFERNCRSFNGLSFHHLLGPIRTINGGSGRRDSALGRWDSAFNPEQV